MLGIRQKNVQLSGLTFLLGIFAASYLPVLPDLRWSVLLVVLLAVTWVIKQPFWFKTIVWFISGGLWLIAYVAMFSPAQLPLAVDSQTITVTGQIVSIPQNSSQRSRFDFLIDAVDDIPTDWRGKVRLSWYYPKQPLQAGQRWRMKIKLKPAHGFANPGGFDYETWLFRQSISATGYVRDVSSADLLGQATTLHQLRQSLSESIRQALPDSRHSALLIALATGDKQYIEARQWQVMTRTGTVHLMAISGLHIGLIYGLFFWLGRMLWRLSSRLCLLRPAQDVAVVTGLIAAIGYAAMAGFSIPTQRALIMLMVVATALLSRRMTSPLDVLQLALLIVLLLDPLAILSVGFWLSFAAVAVILLTLDRSQEDSHKPAWYSLLKIQWVIALGLLPLTSLFFYQVSVVAPVTNLLAVPWVGLLVVPLVLTGVILLFISPLLGQWVLSLADGLMDLLWRVLLPASDSPYAVIHPADPSIWVLSIAFVGIALVLFHRVTLYRLAGLLLLAPLFLASASPVERDEFQVDFLDVGQGLAVVVRTAEHTLLYDTAYSNDSGFDVGQRVILPYLRHEGISVLNHVVLSHDDRDHVGGYAGIRRVVQVGQLSVMPGSRYLSAQATACKAGDKWRWDGVEFSILHPQVNAVGKDNDQSCVLKISGHGGSVLLTGDIEKMVEQQLVLSNPEQLPADILLAPHHGSATSSSSGFIDHVKPKEVVYSAGFRNRFGFPKAVVAARYEQAGVMQWNTADSGMIRYRFDGQTPSWQRWTYRHKKQRFWQYHAVE